MRILVLMPRPSLAPFLPLYDAMTPAVRVCLQISDGTIEVPDA